MAGEQRQSGTPRLLITLLVAAVAIVGVVGLAHLGSTPANCRMIGKMQHCDAPTPTATTDLWGSLPAYPIGTQAPK